MPLYEGVGVVADRHAVILDIGTAYTKCGLATEPCPRFILPSEIYDWKTKSTRKVVDYNCVKSEQYDVPSIVFLPSHLAACFPLGTQGALVVDVGFRETLVLPIYEGIPMLNCWQASPVGQYRILELRKECLFPSTKASFIVLQCFRSLRSFLMKFSKVEDSNGELKPLSSNHSAEILNQELLENVKVMTSFVTTLERAKKIQATLFNGKVPLKSEILGKVEQPPPDIKYSLNESSILHVDGFIRESINETLFIREVDDKSIPQLILDSILKCPIDLRRYFLSRIHVVGGTTMCPGFMDRLKRDLLDLLKDEREIYHKSLPSVEEVKFFPLPIKANCMSWLGECFKLMNSESKYCFGILLYLVANETSYKTENL
uniref:Actin-related protein 10 n=1 Tax=Romanomermis culicivorax TaxID=13658 RepID=A0A915IUY8_ROMCU